MATQNLLIELFVEELPPKALKKLGEAFSSTVFESLKAQGLASENAVVTAFATPRRLAVHVTAVSAQAADKNISQKLMPVSVGLDANGNATPALIKRLQGLGLDETAVAKLSKQPDGKNEALFIELTQTGASLQTGLQKALDETLAKLPIPKVMTYQLADGWSNVNFVRPAHGLVALHGSEVVPVTALGLTAGNITNGHRFEAKQPTITLKNANSYAEQLKNEGAVIASYEERRAEIVRQLNAAAAKENLKPIEDEALLDEVNSLVELPNVLLGQFEKEFLEVPQECLILTMKANQKYFPLLDASGKLTNKFLIVSNIKPADASAVIGGNERVVRPRLADAKFFFDQDRKKTLESRLDGLDKVVYHNKLGSQGERNTRVVSIAKAIAEQLGDAKQVENVALAARLSKADLLTDMVGEFPELQGIMGRYYAQHEKLDNDVAFAIEDHYKPRFAGDTLPRSQTGLVVALADKLETLVGMFGIGNIPTGDKDPFALRRHALGILRMLSEKKLTISLEQLLKTTIANFPDGLLQLEFKDGNVVVMPLWTKLQFFLQERATGYLKDTGYTNQEAESVIYMATPAEYISRLEAVKKARASFPAEFDLLANADKRARNIINKSGMPSEVLTANLNICTEDAEKSLLIKTRELRNEVNELANNGNFNDALLLTVQISNPVTAFFDSVMVNADDEATRFNRFRILHEVTGLTNRVADLSKLAS
ncbi:MAG TPA: glycine--tRNA ligase subunit beta [Methylotenera sp.]|nr:glycine--tRNA ligase subunit beta [Methylotenera sp.]HPH05501.1 glycine--tRNA ligase subunit beta [Methylotenera sp.]HPN00085.1 glycine--tRNA ligase subunit beta [Methylotenera sp.]